MAKVYSQYYAGKTVNVPHSEHRQSAADEKEKNSVTFGADGFAEVSQRLARSLVEFYPRFVSVVKAAAKK